MFLSAGGTLHEFWKLTPKEVGWVLDGLGKRLDREYKLSAWQAWHVAALSRAKKLPSLKSILPGEKKKLRGWKEQMDYLKSMFPTRKVQE